MTAETFDNTFTVTFIRTKGKLVMFDSSTGGQLAPTAGLMMAKNMYSAGIEPSKITDIIVTHFHPDHISGMISQATNSNVFPQANIAVPATELAFWTDSTKLADAQKALGARVQASLAKWKNVRQIKDNDEVIPGVRAVASYGHTAGHTSYIVSSGKKQMLVGGDITGLFAVNAANPGWHVIFDADAAAAEATRRKTDGSCHRRQDDRDRLPLGPAGRWHLGEGRRRLRARAGQSLIVQQRLHLTKRTEPPPARKRAAVLFPRVVVMAKTPVLGLVKTRLGREIGAAEATRVFRATSSAVLGRLSADRRFQTILAIAPDSGVTTRGFDTRIARIPQGGGDLGDRMLRAAERAPPGPVLIIGTDIPSITPAILARALHALGRHDVVVGPADDGGFWMIGFKRRPNLPRCFTGVRWSHAETLADVLANLKDRRVARVETLSDIDNANDVRRLAHHIGRRVI